MCKRSGRCYNLLRSIHELHGRDRTGMIGMVLKEDEPAQTFGRPCHPVLHLDGGATYLKREGHTNGIAILGLHYGRAGRGAVGRRLDVRMQADRFRL